VIRPARWLAPCLVLLAAVLAPIGCAPTEVDTAYGWSRGGSINGTSALAELIRDRGHEVRSAVRLTETLGRWADVLVRFSPHPGPPARDESRWLLDWLAAGSGRKIVYVPRDFDAQSEFWGRMMAAQPSGTPAEAIEPLRRRRDASQDWAADLPPQPKTPAPPEEWFAVAPGPSAPATSATLGGPWAEGVDAGAAAVSRHEAFRPDEEEVLLVGDGRVLAMDWTTPGGGAVLAVANGSFLLNAALLNRARRPLALRAVDWIGEGPRHVAFVDGPNVLAGDEPPSSSPLHLFQVAPFGWVAAHLAAFGVLFCLALATTLGRPRPAPAAEVDRPSAHPEALGALLARTGRADAARALLEAYRRWRHPSAPPPAGRAAPRPPTPPPVRAPLA